MGKYFGTDGFRGEAGVTLTSDHAYRIGRFLGWYYSDGGKKKVRAVIGKDTRRSSYMFEYAIVAGLTASGADAYMLHVTTTPSVSYAVAGDDFDCGVMISASHNPFTDNGIKLVNRRGEKIDDGTIAAIEDYLDGKTPEVPYATGENLGQIVDYAAGRNRYIGYLISLSRYSFKPFRVGLDCANGASWMIARSVFEALGAQVSVINASPDGLNINRGAGSTHIEGLVRHVRENRLDIGFAFDGDADRCIAVDEHGQTVDGDCILYILATRLAARGALGGNTVVCTVMSNSGLFKSLEAAGIRSEQTAVGDRFVYECMQQNGYSLGGEQSGHIILRKYATTGDGLLTAIMLAEEMRDRKASLSQLAAPVLLYPQTVRSIRVTDKSAAMNDPIIRAEFDAVNREIGGNGRALLRASGTEPVLRIMLECETEALCSSFTDRIADVIRKRGYCCE